jgi:OmpA-OmpF porin, OOP family
MKKLNKVAMLFASAALVTAAGAQTIDNWRNGSSELGWKNGTNELCWRDAFWTPATALAGCDGAIVAPKPAMVAPVAPAVVAPRAATPPPAVVPPATVATKVTFL